MALSLATAAGCRPVLPHADVDVDDGTTGGDHGSTTGDGTTESPASTGPERTELSGSGSGSGGTGLSPPPVGGLESSGTGIESTASTESTASSETSGSTETTTGASDCGNGSREAPEACDGLDLGGIACGDLGFLGGALACAADCTHDPTSCIQSPEVSSLFFSEYVEGKRDNKALEIYNPAGSAVDLGSCAIGFHFNGISEAGTTIPLAGTVASNDVLVVCDSRIDPIAEPACGISVKGPNWFNGNDAITLVCNENLLDAFGQVGLDPGVTDLAEAGFPQWLAAPVGTANEILRRDCMVTEGDTNDFDPFVPSLEWSTFPVDDFSDLGQHVCP